MPVATCVALQRVCTTSNAEDILLSRTTTVRLMQSLGYWLGTAWALHVGLQPSTSCKTPQGNKWSRCCVYKLIPELLEVEEGNMLSMFVSRDTIHWTIVLLPKARGLDQEQKVKTRQEVITSGNASLLVSQEVRPFFHNAKAIVHFIVCFLVSWLKLRANV